MREPRQVREDKTLVVNGGKPRIADSLPEDSGIMVSAAEDVAAVVRTGRTVHWGGGPAARELERRFAARIGRSRAFFHNSGTAALQTALFALGVSDGTPVAVSNSGFVASVNVIYHLRARPVFLPTDPQTMVCRHDVRDYGDGIDIHTALITHFFGNVVDIPALRVSLAPQYLVEDAGQAHGATLNGKPVGSFGEIGSFAGSLKKLVTAGQGGLNVFDDPEVERRMRVYAHHGKEGKYDELFPGYNFRGGEMEATLALAALDDLDARVERRNRTAAAICAVLDQAGIPFARVPRGTDCTPAWFDVAVLLDESWLGHRNWLIETLEADGIPLWRYSSLIGLPWVKPYMSAHGWWTDRDEEVLRAEQRLWDRLVLIATQTTPADGQRIAVALAEVMT